MKLLFVLLLGFSSLAQAQTSCDLTCAVQQLTDAVNTVFALPDPVAFSQAWAFGFTLPMFAGIVGYAVGAILEPFKKG